MSIDLERKLLMEVSTLLKSPSMLGLKQHDGSEEHKEDDETTQYNYENINAQFALDVSHLPHADEITQAFRNAHNYQMADAGKFYESFHKSLKLVPAEEQVEAMKVLQKVCDKFGIGTWGGQNREADLGWNPRLPEIVKMTKEGK